MSHQQLDGRFLLVHVSTFLFGVTLFLTHSHLNMLRITRAPMGRPNDSLCKAERTVGCLTALRPTKPQQETRKREPPNNTKKTNGRPTARCSVGEKRGWFCRLTGETHRVLKGMD